MGKAGYEVREARFRFLEETTEVYVLLMAWGDCPLGVQGWHFKSFPKGKNAVEILQEMGMAKDDPVLWPQEAPP